MRRLVLLFAMSSALAVAVPAGSFGADHGDSPLLVSIGRHDARITDLHAFTVGGDLVLTLCTNPSVPAGLATYTYPSDLTLKLNIDNHSDVSFDDPGITSVYGGDILDPSRVSADIVLEFTFDEAGLPRLRLQGLPSSARSHMQIFAGLRDDPFIRGPRIGRNVAAIVVQMPLSLALGRSSTLLVWGTSKVPDVFGPISEHAGRALRSMFSAEDVLNTSSPRDQSRLFGLRPDVVIFDTSRAALFPNGRALEDDVVDMTSIPSMLSSDAPFPSENDCPFLPEFPYLSPPQ